MPSSSSWSDGVEVLQQSFAGAHTREGHPAHLPPTSFAYFLLAVLKKLTLVMHADR